MSLGTHRKSKIHTSVKKEFHLVLIFRPLFVRESAFFFFFFFQTERRKKIRADKIQSKEREQKKKKRERIKYSCRVALQNTIQVFFFYFFFFHLSSKNLQRQPTRIILISEKLKIQYPISPWEPYALLIQMSILLV